MEGRFGGLFVSEDVTEPTPEEAQVIYKFLIASDGNNQLWRPPEVARARTYFAKLGGMPTYSRLCQLFGEEAMSDIVDALTGERGRKLRFDRQLSGIDSPCHHCEEGEQLDYFPFGLVKVTRVKRDWAVTGLSVAASALTLPLFGMGMVSGPDKTMTGQILRLQLVLCSKCVAERKNLFGVFVADVNKCRLHPLWTDLQSAGFTKFVPGAQLASWR